MICSFCNREIEITDDCVFLNVGARHQLVRMPDGQIHQLKDKPPKNTRLKGAFVVPPKPVEQAVIEAVEVVEPITEESSPNIEELARDLRTHFKNPEPTPESEPYHAGGYTPEPNSSEHAVEEIGNVIEGVVVSFRPKFYSGFIRINRYGRSKSGLFFGQDDIKSGDFIGVGSRVRCLVGPPNSGNEGLTAREIEILPDPEPILEPKRKPVMKIYEHKEG